MKPSKVIGLIVLGGIGLFVVNMLFLSNGRNEDSVKVQQKFREVIKNLQEKSERQKDEVNRLQESLLRYQRLKREQRQQEEQQRQRKQQPAPHGIEAVTGNHPIDADTEKVLPILLFACDRVTVMQALDDLIKYRPSKELFPIIVSQDCDHTATSEVIDRYGDNLFLHLHQPDQSPIPNLSKKEKKLEGYYKIARHYKFGLHYVFNVLKFQAVIIVEDDLNIAADFYGYFKSLRPILEADSTLFCVSAWNDNGKEGLIENNPELLYRSDFFPGLGWMMTNSLWAELEPKWPIGFWDDWLRNDEQRKGRACIRPEVSRTTTFGKKGVSKGEFFDKHLKFIKLNDHLVDWESKDLTYLVQGNYDKDYHQLVYNTPEITPAELTSPRIQGQKAVRLTYRTKNEFKSIVKKLKLMEDLKEGVPRTAYMGIIPIMHQGIRLYIAPPPDWSGYNREWK